MAATHPDPIELLSTLSASAIRERLDALDAEYRGLRVLLRATEARERAVQRTERARHGAEVGRA